MAKKEHLHRLFDAHTKDLNDILRIPEEVIACPICLEKFPRESIDLRLVNDGHVWPKDIRKMSEKAAHMQVILCKSCNEASSRADKQMQIFENVKKGEETGYLYGTRLVQLKEEDSDKPIELRVNVKIVDGKTYTIDGRLGENLSFKDTSPEDKERFDAIFQKKKKVQLTIHPPDGYNPDFVPAAWITSAYLMAFYALGYRYIMQPGMQVVRDYILDTFEKSGEEIEAPNKEDFRLAEYHEEYYADPVISFIFSLDPNVTAFLQVSFLRYEVRLPIKYQRSVLEFMVNNIVNTKAPHYEEVAKQGNLLYFQVLCTKTVIHNCIFDYLIGKLFKPKEDL